MTQDVSIMEYGVMATVEFGEVVRSTVIESKEFVPSCECHLFFSHAVMGFPKYACDVAKVLQPLCKNWLGRRYSNIWCAYALVRPGIIRKSKSLLVATREKASARWRAYRAGYIAISEPNAAVCN